MKTVYSNTRRPELVKWGCIIFGVICVASFILYAVLKNDISLLSFVNSLVLFTLLFAQQKLSTYTIDDEADTITLNYQKKYPLRLSDIKTITYKENKKGKFRSLFIHDSGVGFMDIRTSRENADKITAQLLAANPSAEVKHANYI